MLDVQKIRKEFPILSLSDKERPIYFDNACATLRPRSVVQAISDYYLDYPACAGRSAHSLAEKVTWKVQEARRQVAKFINARDEREIVFTRNTTEGINLLASSLGLKHGEAVVISDKEHNSNLVPWLKLKDKIGIEVRIVRTNPDGSFDLDDFTQKISGARLASLALTSNLDGTTIPAQEIIEIAHKNRALVNLDCAQSVSHQKIDVQKLKPDFLAFSGQKLFGPSGIGVLYGQKDELEKLEPFIVGGGTVLATTYDSYQLLPPPERFEAGLQNYAGIIGLGEAIKFIDKLSFNAIQAHESHLNTYITERIKKIPGLAIIGPSDPSQRAGIVNFYLTDINVQMLAVMLEQTANIKIRAGQHCVHSWYQSRRIINSARVSLTVYNTEEEAEIFVESLEKVVKVI